MTPEISLDTLNQAAGNTPNETKVASLDKLISDAQDNAGDARGFMEPKSSAKAKKGKGGRPRKDPNDPKWAGEPKTTGAPEAPPAPGLSEEEKFNQAKAAIKQVITPTLQTAFGVLTASFSAKIGAPTQLVSETDIANLSDAYSALAAKYAPAMLSDYAIEITALMVTAMTYFSVSANMQKAIQEKRIREAQAVQNGTEKPA